MMRRLFAILLGRDITTARIGGMFNNRYWRHDMRIDAGWRLRRYAGFALVCLTAFAQAPANAGPVAKSDSNIAARVNGQPVKRSLVDQMARMRAGVQNPYDEALHPRSTPNVAALTEAERAQLIEDLVATEVLAQKARELGLHQRPQVAADMELQQKTLLSEYMVREIIKDIKIDPAEVTARYAAMEAEPQHRISHILLKTEADAKEAIADLDRGTSFERVVAARSLDRNAGKDGSLGWLTERQMFEPFAIAARSLSPGGYTRQPVQTEFGWHVIRLHETREYKKPLNEQLQKELRAQILQEKVDARLNQLRQAAKVEIRPAR
jgi:peptidyl-prolyl cis-trans isomerase C